jgi:hypothetical protein
MPWLRPEAVLDVAGIHSPNSGASSYLAGLSGLLEFVFMDRGRPSSGFRRRITIPPRGCKSTQLDALRPVCIKQVRRDVGDPAITRLVRVLTTGCVRPGVFEHLYADLKPRRQKWARRGRCGEMSRNGGIILCEKHPSAAEPFLPRSWQVKAS